ncbi:SDR family oxidoreductase [Metabacillus sp. HB246100]
MPKFIDVIDCYFNERYEKIDGVDNFVYTEYDHFVGQRDEKVYVKSKLESEKLIEQARRKGLNCNIYRVDNLNYNTKTMKFQENIESNAFYTMVKSFIKLIWYLPLKVMV